MISQYGKAILLTNIMLQNLSFCDMPLTIRLIFPINHQAHGAGNLIESSDSHLRNHSTLVPV